MTRQMNSTRRPTSAPRSAAGLKALIMAASVALTLGGWGILAANQTQDALASAPQSQAFVQPVNPTNATRTNNSSTLQGQTTAPLSQPRAIARTRSSR
jgi:hypothetical protein